MTAADLLATLRRRGVQFEVREDRLRLRAPEGAITDDDRTLLRQHKPQILRLLHRDCVLEVHGREENPIPAVSIGFLIAERAGIFLAQVQAFWSRLSEEWAEVEHLPIPPLSLPGVMPAPGTCQLCGGPNEASRTFRCAVCVEAVNLMLAGLDDGASCA
jgi:tubulysin polyketide synthase-like protein